MKTFDIELVVENETDLYIDRCSVESAIENSTAGEALSEALRADARLRLRTPRGKGYKLDIDGPQFRQQREFLDRLLTDVLKSADGDLIGPLEGLIELCDEIA